MATKYVRASGGSDSNDGSTFALGWATLTYALANMGTGDTLRICSDSTTPFTITSTLTFAASASGSTPIFEGADLVDGSPYDGSGQAYIEAGSAVTYMAYTVTVWPQIFKDLYLDGKNTALSCLWLEDVGIVYNVSFFNVTCDDAVIYGINVDTDSENGLIYSSVNFINCEVLNCTTGLYNGANGGTVTAPGGPVIYMENCSIHDNSSHNIITDIDYARLELYGCRIFNAGGCGIKISSGGRVIGLNSCIIHYNTSHGIDLGSELFNYVTSYFNNIISSNGGYGINTSASSALYAPPTGDYNCYYNNDSGNFHPNINGGTVPGNSNVLADPQFINTLVGSEDFRLKSTSPCLNTGIGYKGAING